jgi:hypothetical protein
MGMDIFPDINRDGRILNYAERTGRFKALITHLDSALMLFCCVDVWQVGFPPHEDPSIQDTNGA